MLRGYIFRLWLISILVGSTVFTTMLDTTGQTVWNIVLFALTALIASAVLAIPSFLLLWLILRLFTRIRIRPVLLKVVMILLTLPLTAIPGLILLLFIDLQEGFLYLMLPYWTGVLSGILFFSLPDEVRDVTQA